MLPQEMLFVHRAHEIGERVLDRLWNELVALPVK